MAQADGDQVGLPAEKMRVSPLVTFLTRLLPARPRPFPCVRAQAAETIDEDVVLEEPRGG